jgi:hypothetical protein
MISALRPGNVAFTRLYPSAVCSRDAATIGGEHGASEPVCLVRKAERPAVTLHGGGTAHHALEGTALATRAPMGPGRRVAVVAFPRAMLSAMLSEKLMHELNHMPLIKPLRSPATLAVVNQSRDATALGVQFFTVCQQA